MAIKDLPLFPEKIEHWDHGPVVPNVYKIYKKYGKDALPIPDDIDRNLIPDESREIIDDVLEVYGQFSASKLRNLTHYESPWADTMDCEEITHDMLRDFFKTRLIK